MTAGGTTPPDPTQAADLGSATLAALVAGAACGIVVIDADRRIAYANPAACSMLGQPAARLRGTDIIGSFPPSERAALLPRLRSQPIDPGQTFSATIVHDVDNEREIVSTTFPVRTPSAELVGVMFWDLSGPHDAARRAVALAQTAARMVGTAATNELLQDIARHAVERTGASTCGIAVVGADDRFVAGGGYGPGYSRATGGAMVSPGWVALAHASGAEVVSAMTDGVITIGATPGRPVVLSDAQSSWNRHPATQAYAETLAALEWRSTVNVPLAWQNTVIGLLIAYLPPGVAGPDESELAFLTALADQAALVVTNARLAEEAALAAALSERSRLARELHDSVSQGLFSMTMHAGAAQLAMPDVRLEDDGRLARSIGQLTELTRGALAEMRALIFELRPSALAEEGLTGALRRHAVLVAAREGLEIAVRGPERVELPPMTEEHLYRIASEALHNIVKHAHAVHVTVDIDLDESTVRLVVLDDGQGFDPLIQRPGHLGLSTMAQRAVDINATYEIRSSPGRGTTVTVVTPRSPRV